MADISKIYLAHSRDERVRFSASSGGFIKSFLCFLLASHKVDYAIVTRTGGPESPLLPETIVTNRKDEIISTRTNSVYCENNPFKNIKIWPDKKYAFVGLPCQVRKARSFPAVRFVISLICNHAPGPEFTREVLRKLEVEESRVRQIEYRGSGWPGGFTAYLKDGSRRFISGYWNDKYRPAACEECRLSGRDADIIAGDPWHISTDKRGETLVVCRSRKAGELLKKAGSYISLKQLACTDFEKSQGRHFKGRPL